MRKPEPKKSESNYPMRINKYLALKNYSTRRGADELITKGRVFINGKKAILGDKISESDVVDVRFREKEPKYTYFAYNKPQGVITHSPQGDEEEDIKESVRHIPQLKDTFPIGRLDKDSHGLIILTNDGRITDKLLNPENEHEKEYVVRTKMRLRESFKNKMEEGVNIEGYVTKPSKIEISNDKTFVITIREGKKHQIRRMVVALHNEVEDLKRTRILNIRLGDLAQGSYREIKGEELKGFLQKLGM